eukprot:6464153-Pyramimonas_sp.AAC.2
MRAARCRCAAWAAALTQRCQVSAAARFEPGCPPVVLSHYPSPPRSGPARTDPIALAAREQLGHPAAHGPPAPRKQPAQQRGAPGSPRRPLEACRRAGFPCSRWHSCVWGAPQECLPLRRAGAAWR